MSIAGIKSHLANWREWELNPIVIKELRQAVRSWAVTGMLLLFLVVLFIASLVFLISNTFENDVNLELGAGLFETFLVILTMSSVLFIPLYVGVRVAAERQENNPDLLYVSTLSPLRIIFGKFLCGAYVTVLFFSVCMPFMAFTNLLRGVDLPTVFFILCFLFLVVCGANMIAIFLACLPLSRPFKFLFVLYGIGQSLTMIGPLTAFSFQMMRSGIGAMMSRREVWIGVMTDVGLTLALIGLFFTMSVALISPQSSNRALPVRLYITIMWLLGGVSSFIWVMETRNANFMSVWTITTFVLMMLSLLVVISNADRLSLRVRRTIPRSLRKRVAVFFFFNGAAGGLLWIVAILMGTYFAARAVIGAYPVTLTGDENRHWFVTTTAYAFDYALTALFLQRNYLSRRPPKIAGVLAVLLAASWAILPAVVLFFLNQLSWKSVEGLELGNVFNLFVQHDERERMLHQFFALGWLFLAILINAPWFIRQVKNFQPAVRNSPESPPPVLN
jgi:hypothetical protein